MTLFDEAIFFATERHSGQYRKINHEPYILHPMEVAAIVSTMTTDQEVLCAAVLHDTVEDTDTTEEEIRQHFGSRVAFLVMSETEQKRTDLPADQTWRIRKEETLTMLQQTRDLSVKILWLGDKLSNIRSFMREYAKVGHDVWQSCNQKDPAMQAWYYITAGRSMRELAEYPAYHEYVDLIRTIFDGVADTTVVEA